MFYLARRLKRNEVISNYRLDENANTHIALSINKQSFKFTGLDQLRMMNIAIPEQIIEEITTRRTQISQNEERAITMNNEKSSKIRQNLPTSNVRQASDSILGQYQNVPNIRPPLTGANMVPIGVRPSAPNQFYRPPVQPNSSFQSVQQLPLTPSRTKSVKRPYSTYPSPVGQDIQTVQDSAFRYPPPSQIQHQFPYPPSYWTTPPPGEGVGLSGQVAVSSSTISQLTGQFGFTGQGNRSNTVQIQ